MEAIIASFDASQPGLNKIDMRRITPTTHG
jgi:hypothetical protein